MIQLKPDHLIFQISNGEQIPCSAEMVAVELMGDSAELLDPQVIQEAATAVLHYFKEELHRVSVSVEEFSEVLEKVLKGLGIDVSKSESMVPTAPATPLRVAEADLLGLANDAGPDMELAFFHRLREELHRQLESAPELVRFKSLRPCVKRLTGCRHWSRRCQKLSDEIVDYLRGCLTVESSGCAMMVC